MKISVLLGSPHTPIGRDKSRWTSESTILSVIKGNIGYYE